MKKALAIAPRGKRAMEMLNISAPCRARAALVHGFDLEECQCVTIRNACQTGST